METELFFFDPTSFAAETRPTRQGFGSNKCHIFRSLLIRRRPSLTFRFLMTHS